MRGKNVCAAAVRTIAVFAMVSAGVGWADGQASVRGDRCTGQHCRVKTLEATSTKTTGAYSWGVKVTGGICLDTPCTARFISSGGAFHFINGVTSYLLVNPGVSLSSVNVWRGPDGTAATPAFGFTSDPNTGLFSSSADNIGVALGGTEAFRFRSGGYLSNGSLNATLTLNDGTGAVLQYATSMITLDGSSVTISPAANGTTIAGQAPTTFYTSGARKLNADSYTGGLYWQQSAVAASTPAFDLGGKAHPVLQRRTYVIDVGTESSAAPTWAPAPRTGGTTATVTVSETTAGATTAGTSPFVFDFRTSTTSTVAGNIASVTGASTGVKLNRGPRWCQRVMPGSVITAVRFWAGLASALPTASDTMTGDGVLFRFSTVAGDSKWQFCTRDGATQTCTDTGVAVAASTPAVLCADCREGSACTAWVNGVARTRKTTNLPNVATNMNPLWTVETTAGGTARTIGVSSASVEFN